jgi:hypothetical protein
MDGPYWMINDDHVVRNVGFTEWMDPQPGWYEWRRVKEDILGDGTVHVSTVFLGVTHSGKPFETMTFSDNPLVDELMNRCETWDEAIEMHKKMVERVQNMGLEVIQEEE